VVPESELKPIFLKKAKQNKKVGVKWKLTTTSSPKVIRTRPKAGLIFQKRNQFFEFFKELGIQIPGFIYVWKWNQNRSNYYFFHQRFFIKRKNRPRLGTTYVRGYYVGRLAGNEVGAYQGGRYKQIVVT
jgi:hypothetical protein